jgi:hypothetical protein
MVATQYSLNVSFSKGVQKFTHTLGEPTKLQLNTTNLEEYDFRPMRSIQEHVKSLVLVDSLSSHRILKGMKLIGMSFDADAPKSRKIFNSTSIYYEACSMVPLVGREVTGMYSVPT